jgi:UDP-GlcNAc3NAcA epimerase
MSPRPERGQDAAVRIVQVVGARPQFVKLAPLCRAIAAANARGNRIESVVVHTGQHYDPAMSEVFFRELDIPQADVHLGVGSGSHGAQTGRMLEKLEIAFVERRPDIVLTYGDTNSTLAATIAAAKLHVPVAHVEAGLRSFNRRMPEEANRLVADHLSDLLFAPTPEAMRNLANEGLEARACLVGDVMLDAVRDFAAKALSNSYILERLGLTEGQYLVATIHRAENTDGNRTGALLDALASIGRPDRPVVLPLHPRTKKSLQESGWRAPTSAGLRLIEPLGYLDMLRLVGGARIVLTDSGGLQKEAFFLNRPCITLRNETEWVETVAAGANIIAGADPGRILDAVTHWDGVLTQSAPDFSTPVKHAFGDGSAADQVVAKAVEFVSSHPVS